MDQAFRDAITTAYTLDEPSLIIGSAMHEGELFNDTRVQVALSMLNRHGLIAGATGTGKTKTLQLMAGQLSKAGVPVFVADIKGDLTGLAAPGGTTHPKLIERTESLAWTFEASGHPVEFLSLTGKLGAQVRATVSSFGPLLLGKVLDLNETQTSILALVFKYCDDNDLPLLDLKDLAATLKFLAATRASHPRGLRRHVAGVGRGPAALDRGPRAGGRRRLLRRAGVRCRRPAAHDAGRPGHHLDPRAVGRHGPAAPVLDVHALDAGPAVRELPEAGDLPKPKLCFFFDEAHLLFDDASDALMDQIERTARLIRSKGVGVYFVTQVPADVPSSVLAQLGNRVQHALRAFTPEDADNLRKAARTFPMTDFYEVETTLTSLGTGEALVTVLSPKGVPTELAATRLLPPDSLMAPIDEVTFRGHIAMSPLQSRYGATVNRDSAYERITARLTAAREAAIAATQEAAVRAGVDPTTAAGMNSMTPAQLEREMRRQQKELEAAQVRAAREAERQRKAEEKAAIAAAKARQKTIDTALRTGGKVVTSRLGQDIVRGIFGTLFGGGKKR